MSVSQCQSVSVCVVKGDPWLSWLRQGKRTGGAGKILSGSDFCGSDDNQTHTLDSHAKASLPVWDPPLLSLFLSLLHTPNRRHTHQSLKITA